MKHGISGTLDQLLVSSKPIEQSTSKTTGYVSLSEALASSLKRKRKAKYTTLDEIKKRISSMSDGRSSRLDSLNSSHTKTSKKRDHKLKTSEHDSMLTGSAKSDQTLHVEPYHDLSAQIHEKPCTASPSKVSLSVLKDTNSSISTHSAKRSQKNKTPALSDHKSDVVMSNAPDHVTPSSSILSSSSLRPDSNEDPNLDVDAKWADDQARIAKRRKRNPKTYSTEKKTAEMTSPLEDSTIKLDDRILAMKFDSSQWVNIATAARTLEKERKRRKNEGSRSRTTEQDENTYPGAGSLVDQECPHEVERRVKKTKRDRKKLSESEVDSQQQSSQKGTEVEPKTLSSPAAINGSEVNIQNGDLTSKLPETSEGLSSTRPHKKREKKYKQKPAHEGRENSSRQQDIGQPAALPSEYATIDTTEIQDLVSEGNQGQSEDLTVISDRRKREKNRAGEPREQCVGTAADVDHKNESADTEAHMIIDPQPRATEDFNDPSRPKKSKKKRLRETDLSSQMTPAQDDPTGQVSKPESSAETAKRKRKSSSLKVSDGVKKHKKRQGGDQSADALPDDGNETFEPTLEDQVISPMNSKWARENPVFIDATNRHWVYRLEKFSDTMREALVGLTRDEILKIGWLRPPQLKELVDVFGFEYKQGRYSDTEKATISSTIALYQKQHNLSDEGMRELIIPTRVGVKIDKTSENSIFRELASKLPGRSLISIWKTVTRAWEVNSKQGRWKKDEDQRLIDAVTQHGRSWVKVSSHVGRPPGDCLDRWRESVSLRTVKKSGIWTPEEEDQLVMIMKRHLEKMKAEGDLKYEGLWSQVSVEMGGKRSPKQCAIKWIMTLKDKTLYTTPRGPWKHRDILILVRQLEKHEMEEDTGFDWKLLSHEGWDRWPADTLRRRWKQIKKYYLRKFHDYHENPSPSVPEIVKGILKIWSQRTQEELDRSVRRKSEVKVITPSVEKVKKKRLRSKRPKEVNEEDLQEDEIKELDQE